jgi:signal transduction histidine kinase
MEASKASTGNVEVNPEACDVGVLLTQVMGEFQQRMEEQELELLIKQPEQPTIILADPRLLWRVMDNLINNICKYSQKGTRVYASVEEKGERVVITLKNISKYALDMEPDELMERFIRGDRSRHTEGNGLGLNIAKSLTELQGGTLKLSVDGDLFKVLLTFPKYEISS